MIVEAVSFSRFTELCRNPSQLRGRVLLQRLNWPAAEESEQWQGFGLGGDGKLAKLGACRTQGDLLQTLAIKARGEVHALVLDEAL